MFIRSFTTRQHHTSVIAGRASARCVVAQHLKPQNLYYKIRYFDYIKSLINDDRTQQWTCKLATYKTHLNLIKVGLLLFCSCLVCIKQSANGGSINKTVATWSCFYHTAFSPDTSCRVCRPSPL